MPIWGAKAFLLGGLFFFGAGVDCFAKVVRDRSYVLSIAAGKEMTVGGVKSVFFPTSDSNVIALALFIVGGSAYQDKEKAGIEELTLSLFEKGSQKYGKDRISEIGESSRDGLIEPFREKFRWFARAV